MKTTPRIARIISGFISVSRRRPKSFQLEPCFQAGCFKSNEFVVLLILSRIDEKVSGESFKKKTNSPVYSLSLVAHLTIDIVSFCFFPHQSVTSSVGSDAGNQTTRSCHCPQWTLRRPRHWVYRGEGNASSKPTTNFFF